MKMKAFAGLLLMVTSLSVIILGCNKEIEGPRLNVTPYDTQFSRQPGALMEFGISASAEEGLKSLRITKKINNTVTESLLDTVLSGDQANFKYPFVVPTEGVTQIYFVFTLEDMEGRKVSTPRRLIVQGAALLTESAGHELAGIHAGDDAQRAFNISDATLFQITPDVDSTLIDLVEHDPLDDDALGLSLKSFNGLKFVKANNNTYNYANATFATAKSAYENGSELEIAGNLTSSDILITRYSTDPERYAVIDIVEIHDEEGSSNDYYRFNLKK